MSLTKDQIIGCRDIPAPEAVDVPEWGGQVHLRVLTGAERDAFEARFAGSDKAAGLRNVRAFLLVRCLCDEAGERLFEDGDAEALGAKSASVLGRLFETAMELNGIGAEAVEELAGN